MRDRRARFGALAAAGAVLFIASEQLFSARRLATRRAADERRRLAVALLAAVRALDVARVPYAFAGDTARDVAGGATPRAGDALDFAAYRTADGPDDAWAAVHEAALRHGLVTEGREPTDECAALRFRHSATGTAVRVALRDNVVTSTRAVAFHGRVFDCEL